MDNKLTVDEMAYAYCYDLNNDITSGLSEDNWDCAARLVIKTWRDGYQKRGADDLRVEENLRYLLNRVIGLHTAPRDCYSTGPHYGDLRDEMCPSCEALRFLSMEGKQQVEINC